MMTKAELLDIEVQLLLFKYGEDAVVKAIATSQGASLAEIASRIGELRKTKATAVAPRKQKKTAVAIANEVAAGSPNQDLILELAARFQSRRFLPELKDVKRFAERNGVHANFSSRDASVSHVFAVLLRFERSLLEELISQSQGTGESAFSRLSKQIIERSSE